MSTPDDAPRAYTTEEMRELFLAYLHNMISYWATVELRSPPREFKHGAVHERLEGLAHSILVAFDGAAGELPAFDLVPAPHEEDEAYCREEGENWWSAAEPINGDVRLHECEGWRSS